MESPSRGEKGESFLLPETVTQIQSDYGMAGDSIFFLTRNVKGPLPKLGDRVLVEAESAIGMPFKFVAKRVLVVRKDPDSVKYDSVIIPPAPQLPQYFATRTVTSPFTSVSEKVPKPGHSFLEDYNSTNNITNLIDNGELQPSLIVTKSNCPAHMHNDDNISSSDVIMNENEDVILDVNNSNKDLSISSDYSQNIDVIVDTVPIVIMPRVRDPFRKKRWWANKKLEVQAAIEAGIPPPKYFKNRGVKAPIRSKQRSIKHQERCRNARANGNY